MEGPTPVSALIHAATMVTAGIFLIIRCISLFEINSSMKPILVFIGILTAFFAATTGTAQNDLKRIIAYSTCSQLGYMLASIGISGYSQSLFHLETHACFKALLFLSSGLLIHGISGEQDIRKMVGLASFSPLANMFFLIGTLAILGLAPFAGFYSKEAIFEYAMGQSIGLITLSLLLLIAGVTATYSYRVLLYLMGSKIDPFSDINLSKHNLTNYHVVISFNYIFALVILILFTFFIGINEQGYIKYLNFLDIGIFGLEGTYYTLNAFIIYKVLWLRCIPIFFVLIFFLVVGVLLVDYFRTQRISLSQGLSGTIIKLLIAK